MLSAAPRAGEVLSEPPATPDPGGRYLFYMHGIKVEEEGPNACSKRENACYDYGGITAALAGRGFTVISELRPSGTQIGRYAKQRLIPQIRSLVNRGVPRANITVIGHSKGGVITLVVSNLLRAPQINYVVMAGCGKKHSAFRKAFQRLLDRGTTLHGRVLSLYDVADRDAGSCGEAFAPGTAAETRETAFNTGRGHCLFCVPDEIWIEPVAEWARL